MKKTLLAFVMVMLLEAAGAVGCGDKLIASTTLTTDLSCSGTALLIEKSSVVLDCAGHTIETDGEKAMSTLEVKNAADVEIKNCVIVKKPGRMSMDKNLFIENSPRFSMSNVTVRGASYSLFLADSPDVTLEGITADDSVGGCAKLHLENLSGASLDNFRIQGANCMQLFLGTMKNGVISNGLLNASAKNVRRDMLIQYESQDTVVRDIDIDMGSTYGNGIFAFMTNGTFQNIRFLFTSYIIPAKPIYNLVSVYDNRKTVAVPVTKDAPYSGVVGSGTESYSFENIQIVETQPKQNPPVEQTGNSANQSASNNTPPATANDQAGQPQTSTKPVESPAKSACAPLLIILACAAFIGTVKYSA